MVGPGLDVDWCTITGLFGDFGQGSSKGFEGNRVQMGPYVHMKLQAMGRTSRGHPSRWVVSQASLKYIVLGGTIRGSDGEIPRCSHVQ